MLWSISLSLSLSLSSIVIRIVCDWGLNREMLIRGYQTVGTGTLLQGRIYERLPPKMVKNGKTKNGKRVSHQKCCALPLRFLSDCSHLFSAVCSKMHVHVCIISFPSPPLPTRPTAGREGAAREGGELGAQKRESCRAIRAAVAARVSRKADAARLRAVAAMPGCPPTHPGFGDERVAAR